MPERKETVKPCGNPNRDPLDVAGRINDLINCYLTSAGEYAKVYLPQIIVAIILMVIIFLALREIVED